MRLLPTLFLLFACTKASAQGRIEKVEVTSLTRQHAALWARVSLAKVAEGSKQTFVGEVSVFDVALPMKSPVTVLVQPKGDGSEAVFFLDLGLDKVPEALVTKMSSQLLEVKINGTLTGDKGTKASVCAAGSLKAGPPDFYAPMANVASFASFGGASLKGVSLRETTGEAKAVLFNPFRFSVGVKDVSYTIYVGERKLCSGSRQGIQLHGSRENEITLPLKASNAES